MCDFMKLCQGVESEFRKLDWTVLIGLNRVIQSVADMSKKTKTFGTKILNLNIRRCSPHCA